MHFISIIITLLSLYLSSSLADVSIASPSAGDSYSGSGGAAVIDVKWVDDAVSGSDTFSLTNAQTYTILLCTGSNLQIQCDNNNPLLSNEAVPSDSYSVSIKNTLYPNGYYFLQVYTVFLQKATTTHYSGRFQLTGMQGPTSTWKVTVTGAGPAAQTSGGNAVTTTYNSASFSIPYTLQTGLTRFAPMQTQPGSKVTATTWSIRYPTSSVTLFSTQAGSPVVYSTITPGWDYTPSSLVNWATVATYPNYYYPASSRVSKASLSSATKKKRWLD
ncbi:cell wall synthesis protein KRE9 precursor [Scheffersomyces coipomensis]|uniref:cell wall synthesis protein KRE9 precursor n=1 Tax=Scheffersomyces coipomensis TaxID=1788519 RepID=UPI00315D041A